MAVRVCLRMQPRFRMASAAGDASGLFRVSVTLRAQDFELIPGETPSPPFFSPGCFLP